jgi:peptidoglycan/xylan/chitin deacetylase (PgdA/CDA1 family)
VTALIDGEPADGSVVVEGGEQVSTTSGADVVEPIVEETRTVEATPTVIGDGPVTTIVAPGDDGLERRVLGAVSGDVFAVETVRAPRPGIVRRAPLPGARTIALTFDDGPWPQQTAEVLRILAEKSVPATFFMLGSRVQIAPDLARSVVQAGHVVGNHSYWHPRLDTVPDERIVREIAGANKVIKSATGVRPRWFRAPGGHLDRRVLRFLGSEKMNSALWTIDPQDWRDDATADTIAGQVLVAARPGGIVVLHDGGGDQSATIEALPRIIDGLRAQGYEFVTLDEMRPVKGTW